MQIDINDTWRQELPLFTTLQRDQLIAAGSKSFSSSGAQPLAYLTAPHVGHQWLISALHPNNQYYAYGLFKNFKGKFEIGRIDVQFIHNVHRTVSPVLNNLGFEPQHPLSVYKQVADEIGSIVTIHEGYEAFFTKYDPGPGFLER